MNNALRTILVVLLALVLGIGLFLGGMWFAAAQHGGFGYSMMGSYGPAGMMGSYGYGSGMMGGGYGPNGMMEGYGPGGMMGNYGNPSGRTVSTEDTQKAVETYLARLNNPDLELKEIMTFDNGGYAIVREKTSNVGAFELLVDPVTLAAYPEYGPNMMWNLKYGMMSGNTNRNNNYYGSMGGMMGRWYDPGTPSVPLSAKMPVDAAQASTLAQQYLDSVLPGVTVSDEVTPFYGYYTIDLEHGGKIVGMLSVNGYTGQVFLHTWHGTFLEMTEY